MNDGIKQRIVGAVVLVSLALILWPLLFSPNDNIAMDRTTQIPDTPDFEKYTVSAPTRPTDIEPVETPQPTPVLAPETPAPSVEKKVSQQAPVLDSRNLPVAWTLQVASFSDAANASVLTTKLIKQGYKAYTRTIKSSTSPSTRVYIGPRLTQDAFDKILPEINKSYGVNAIVVRYEQ
jgi:DedD protein